MLTNKNNFRKKMFFSPFASRLIDRCVTSIIFHHLVHVAKYQGTACTRDDH